MTADRYIIDSSALSRIDWHESISLITRYSHFDYTKESLNKIPTYIKPAAIKSLYETSQLFENFFQEYHGIFYNKLQFIPSETNLFNLHTRLVKGAILRIQELNYFALSFETLFNLFDLYTSFSKQGLDQNTKRSINSYLKEVRYLISDDGQIDYFNHPQIRKVYKEILELEKKIRANLQGLINNQYKNKVQFDQFDIHNDHFTIPIRSDSYSSKIGPIIARSDSGQTLYVEPYEIRSLSLSRMEKLSELEEILGKICISLTKNLEEIKDFALNTLYFIYKCDEEFSKLKSYHQGVCIPELADEPQIDLANFYHPLIENPVKNSLRIPTHQSGLAISGPNMGGKTIALKAICINTLYMYKGIKVPSDQCTLFPYKKIYFFGYDNQNILEGDSSFSSEVKNYAQMLGTFESQSLIFIDEIFNTTSSEEASALAISMFDYILSKGTSHILVSTHHQMLKSYLFQDKNFVSAHVGYDKIKNKADFKLYFDSPGASFALEVFKRITENEKYSSEILKRAETILDKKMIHYETLLQEISYKKGILDKEINKYNRLKNEIETQKKSNQAVLKLRNQEQMEKYRKKLDQIIKEARLLSKSEGKGSVKKLEQIKSEHFFEKEDKPALLSNQSRKFNTTEILEGKTYYCSKLNSKVIAKKIDSRKKSVQVSKGNLTISVPINSLTLTKPDKEDFKFTLNSTRDASIRLDCRGMRLDEFQTTVHQSISDLFASKLPFVEIIHGHGDGVLKNWLKKFLKNNNELKIEDSSEGNDGASRISLC